MKKNQVKSMNTMDELRECLRKVRREREELFEEIQAMHAHQQTVKVKEIIRSYQEKGKLDENQWEEEQKSRPYFPPIDYQDSDEGICSGSQASLDQPFRSNMYAASETTVRSRFDRPSKALNSSFSTSPSHTPRASQTRYRGGDSLSPLSRDIYPHRKTYQPRSRSCSPNAASHQISSSNSCTGYLANLDDSFVDQTLQEIERDLTRERQKIFQNASNPPKSRLRSYLSEENLADNSAKFKSTGNVKGSVSDRDSSTTHQRMSRIDSHDHKRPFSARNLSSDRFHQSCSPPRNLPKRSSSISGSPHTSYSNQYHSRSRSPSCQRSPYRKQSFDVNR